jgi:hypothetical protein
MDNNPASIELYQNKSFDELIEEVGGIFYKASQIIPLIFERGRDAGMQDDEIRQRMIAAGVKYRTMLEYMPPDAKREYKRYQSGKCADLAELTQQQQKQQQQSNQAKLQSGRTTEEIYQEHQSKQAPPTFIEHVPEPEAAQEGDYVAMQYQKDMEAEQQQGQAFMEWMLKREFQMKIKLLETFGITKAKGWAKQNGLDYIVFKINRDGEFYLPT